MKTVFTIFLLAITASSSQALTSDKPINWMKCGQEDKIKTGEVFITQSIGLIGAGTNQTFSTCYTGPKDFFNISKVIVSIGHFEVTTFEVVVNNQ